MDSDEFREFGKKMVDFIADYWDSIRERQTLPSVKPGFIENLIPSEAPQDGEDWNSICDDVNKVIMPGLTHWQSPNFHAFYPTGNSFPSMLGEMLTAGLGCIGINWMASPICTELEVTMMNWLGKLFDLPHAFLDREGGRGGGVLQGTSSETILIGILAAREKLIKSLQKTQNLTRGAILDKLVGYTSDHANSCVEKAGKIASITIKCLKTNGELRGQTLEDALKEDQNQGLYPCVVIATSGTTGICSFDNLQELGDICQRENIWLHVDAAYAGSAWACPEHRYQMDGVEFADSINIAPHKLMLINNDCTAMWVKDAQNLYNVFGVDKIYLRHQYQGYSREYHHWQISLGRRFRALKVWFVIRSYGVKGIQTHIRNHVALAQCFKKLVENDVRFEVVAARLGLVCFRLKGENKLTQTLLERITDDKEFYLTPYQIEDTYLIRFAVCSGISNEEDIRNAWNGISSFADQILWNSNLIVSKCMDE